MCDYVDEYEADCSRESPKLSDIPWGMPKTIETMDLSENALTRLVYSDFQGYGDLAELYLYDNQIEYVEPGAFKDLVSLEELDMEDNNLKSYGVGMWGLGVSVHFVYIGRNPNLAAIPVGAWEYAPGKQFEFYHFGMPSGTSASSCTVVRGGSPGPCTCASGYEHINGDAATCKKALTTTTPHHNHQPPTLH